MQKVLTILEKEWLEVFKNRMVLLTVLLVPLVFTLVPLLMLAVSYTPGKGGESKFPLPAREGISLPADASDQAVTAILGQALFLYMIIPVALPTAIAAYSIVGEKASRSLEPLLATPVTTFELFLGKVLAAVIPAVGASWVGFLLFLAGAWVILQEAALVARLVPGLWYFGILVLGPLLSLVSVLVCMMVSSRVSDPRTAEQLSMFLVLPLLFLLFGQVLGWFSLSLKIVAGFALALLILDAGLMWMGIRLFERENILTRWK
jgi:ABC-2 type transport system permease protein